ncbi:hypothetical protein CVIRNUC_009597 [Coccomyxa viridis]|uniref:Uncharacterized protein n=1 Tax=Coccomyxa viridis TaxID=1274662 RepID=A0AAV1IH18_9CHLO|nr:hypothetical protein CVIRNUC_009597 [Coccomyxa viridis]
MVYSIPCIAFGHNMRAVFNRSVLTYALIYFFIIVLAGKLWLTALRMEMLLCPTHGMADGAYTTYLAGLPHRRMLQAPSTQITWSELPHKCQSAIIAKNTCGIWAAFSIFAGIIYCAYWRTQLRKKYGIPGTCCGDWCVWMWCASCALCQETDTILAHTAATQGDDGPAAGLEMPSTCPPETQPLMRAADRHPAML